MFQISDCDAHKTTYLDLFIALFGESFLHREIHVIFGPDSIDFIISPNGNGYFIPFYWLDFD